MASQLKALIWLNLVKVRPSQVPPVDADLSTETQWELLKALTWLNLVEVRPPRCRHWFRIWPKKPHGSC